MILRTRPVSGTGNTGDWFFLYLIDSVRSAQFLPEPFPGFNRTPNSADAEPCFVIRDENGDARMMLQAPEIVTFTLEGSGSRLSLDTGSMPRLIPVKTGRMEPFLLSKGTLQVHTRPRSFGTISNRFRLKLIKGSRQQKSC